MKTYKLEIRCANPFTPVYKIDLGEIWDMGSFQLSKQEFSFEVMPELANEFTSKLRLPNVRVRNEGMRVILEAEGGYAFDLVDRCLIVGALVYNPTLRVTEDDDEA
jgi:hypothetical protein